MAALMKDKRLQSLGSKSTRRISSLGALGAIYIVFHRFFEDIISETVVKHFLSYCESTSLNDSLFILLQAFLLYQVVKNSKRIVSVESQSGILLLLLFYSFYRFSFEEWVFTRFDTFEYVAYSDVLALSAAIYFGVSFLPLLAHPEKNVGGDAVFFDDVAVSENKPDLLGYETYAIELSSRIEATTALKSFAIGINGKWGFGKTSFLRLINKNLRQDCNIIVHFNPWSSQTPDIIVKDFFEVLQQRIRPHFSSLADLLISYSDKLSAVSGNYMAKVVEVIKLNDSIGRGDTRDLYEEINDKLKRLDKKVIVFIDDLDRLDKSELLAVIRLIRNTADFRNTFFIVAYDRDYVLKAIEELNPQNHQFFLEKIFQVEVNLPAFNRRILREEMVAKLKSIISKEYHEEVSTAMLGNGIINPAYFDSWVNSLRDVTRLANSLSINFLKLRGEVNFTDFLNLELLRLKYPSVYELLFRETALFLKSEEDSYRKFAYCLKTKDGQQVGPFQSHDPDNYEITGHLEKRHNSLSIPEGDIRKIVTLLAGIFSNQNSIYKRNHLSVVYPSNFNKYFSYTLFKTDLSELEFSKYRKGGLDEFKRRISDWVERGLEYQLRARFLEVRDFDDKADFETVISGIFYFAKLKPKRENRNRSVIGYDLADLKHKLYDNENRLSDRYYGDKDSLRDFIFTLFNSAEHPYEFESSFIAELQKSYPDGFSITSEELEEIILEYYKKYCDSLDKFEMQVWYKLHDCKVTDWTPNGGGSYSGSVRILEGATEILKEFAWRVDHQGFLMSLIDRNRSQQPLYKLGEMIPQVWGDWESFHLDFLKVSDSEFKDEFERFYQAFASSGFNHYVPFEFKHIDIAKDFRTR